MGDRGAGIEQNVAGSSDGLGTQGEEGLERIGLGEADRIEYDDRGAGVYAVTRTAASWEEGNKAEGSG